MEDFVVSYYIWAVMALVVAAATFYVFGAELPLYLIIATAGLLLYTTAKNPLTKFLGGWIGRLAAILFLVSLVYYIGTQGFFPENIFEFKFLAAGLGFVNELSKNIGQIVLNTLG